VQRFIAAVLTFSAILVAILRKLKRRWPPFHRSDLQGKRELVTSAIWLGLTAILALGAFYITTTIAQVNQWFTPTQYTVAVYASEASLSKIDDPKARSVGLYIVKSDEGPEFSFYGGSLGPGAERIVIYLLIGTPTCKSIHGKSIDGYSTPLTPVKNSPSFGWFYFDIPDNGSESWFISCQMPDYVNQISFQRRDFIISNAKTNFTITNANTNTIGLPDGSVALPIQVNMNSYEPMSDTRFYTSKDERQINAMQYNLKPDDTVTVEWTSAVQESREIYLLVIVGALIALSACTFIEAVRVWLVRGVARVTDYGEGD
jgi:hypothetical protein